MTPLASRGADTTPRVLARGATAGLAGTAVMTAFQLLVEMPLTGRKESYAPANFASRVLRVKPKSKPRRRTLNYAAHIGIGVAWGATHGLVVHKGLRGQRAVLAVFAGIYTGDGLLNTALGLYEPWKWSARDWATDLGEKFILAEATGLIYERLEPKPD
ncbi:MAG: hypothetical protein M3331_06185 [Actinomycetota bacterium]|nr:hypothetical protein [Actinomycetota bacterium]